MRTPLFTQAQLSPTHSVCTRFGPTGVPVSGTRSIEKRHSFEATSQLFAGVILYPTGSKRLDRPLTLATCAVEKMAHMPALRNAAATACLCFTRVSERLLTLALLSAAPLLAQNAELSGLITDPSGLAVPNAKVSVQSVDTGAARTVSSNQQGEYSVPALFPGPYNITIEANRFKAVHQNGVVVEVDQRARLDFALIIGSTTETITVQGSAPLLNTSDASVSTVIDPRLVDNIPLNGRSFQTLIMLTPGVVVTPTTYDDQGQFSVNRQRADANYFMVDGVSANLGDWVHSVGASRRRRAAGA